MATVSDSVQYTLEQKIVPTIVESLWDLDPVYPMIQRSSMNVVRGRGIGRGWNVLKTWSSGVAGGAKFGAAAGGNVVTGPNNFNMYSTPQTFQGVDETTAPAFFQTTTTLIEHRGNFYLPHQIMRADRLDASIGSVVAKNLSGIAELLAMQESSVFYSTSASTGQLAGIGDTSVNVSNKTSPAADTAAMNFDLSGTLATGRVHHFRPGMMIDLYDSTGATKRNAGFYLVVDNVDPLAQTLTIRRVDGGTFQVDTVLGGGEQMDGAGCDLDIIVIKDSVNITPNGPETWMADGSSVTSFFGVDVRNFGQYKSYVPSAVNAALTEGLLNRHFAMFYESFPGRRIDTLLTTMGVLNGFIDNLDSYNPAVGDQPGRFRYDRNGEALTVEAGWDAFRYRFASRPVNIYTSTMVNGGTVYGGRFGKGGLIRYVPPAVPGMKTDSRFGQEVEFVAPLAGSGGYQGIFTLARAANGAITDFVEAPFIRYFVIMPEQPNWFKMTGITEVIG